VQINILLRGYIGFSTEGLHWVTISIWSIIMVKAKLINDPDTVITVKVHILLRGYIGWLIIWDEAPMQHHHIPEAVDRTLRDIHGYDKPFGGLTVVFGGDFLQILPVIIKGSRPQIVGACLQQSVLWSVLKILPLTLNMCLGQEGAEREFAQWQLDVGHRKHTNENSDIVLPNHFKCPENTLKSLIETIYPGIANPTLSSDQYFADCTILSAHNEGVHSINAQILQSFPGEVRVYQSADWIEKEGEGADIDSLYPVEHLNTINISGLLIARLNLKIGCPLMVLQNLNPG
jgi:hypothetical protein